MAIAVPEAAEAVSGGEAAVQGAAARGRARPRVVQATYTSRTEAPPRRPAPRQPRNRRVTPAVNVPSGRRAASRASRARIGGDRNYQPVILAEFLLAVVIVALAPVAKGGTDTAKAKGGASPYDTGSLKQILAIGVVYFVLALVSSGRTAGRYAAWFGGLVVLGLGVQQTVNGGLAGIFRLFTSKDAGAGLGSFPASPPAGSLLPGPGIAAGALGGAALAPGVTASPVPDITGIQGPPPGVSATVVNPVANATGIFPTVEPGGTITNSVITNGLPPSVNLA